MLLGNGRANDKHRSGSAERSKLIPRGANPLGEQSKDAIEASFDDTVDVAIVGAGIGALSAGAVLNSLYGKKVGVFESHYLAGGCAHAFDRRAANGETFTFDSGPTILLG